MKYCVDITIYSDNPQAEPKIYYLSDDKSRMVAMFDNNTDRWVKFKRPITISTKGRKFEILTDWDSEPDSAYFGEPVQEKPQGILVLGSRGDKYYVSRHGKNYSCTCPASKFQRRECKHIITIKERQNENSILQ